MESAGHVTVYSRSARRACFKGVWWLSAARRLSGQGSPLAAWGHDGCTAGQAHYDTESHTRRLLGQGVREAQGRLGQVR